MVSQLFPGGQLLGWSVKQGISQVRNWPFQKSQRMLSQRSAGFVPWVVRSVVQNPSFSGKDRVAQTCSAGHRLGFV